MVNVRVTNGIFFFGKLQNQLCYFYILFPSHSSLFLGKEWKTGFQDKIQTHYMIDDNSFILLALKRGC